MILQQHATGISMPLLSPEEKAHRGLEYLRDALIRYDGTETIDFKIRAKSL
jgi:hypothetical protein